MGEIELGGIRTCTPRMVRLLDLVERFSGLDTPILIEGETGTGKELVARALHGLSDRASKPMVTIDCSALPESLAESELFGHQRGAFTGADRPYPGRIEAAAGGTLFLDEVNAISLSMQGRLLRFLEEREFCRIGQQRPVRVDVRLISASNMPLEQLVASGQMRPDFFYRLNVFRLAVPPLRERLDDLPLLVRQFLAQDPLARQHGVTDVADEVIAQLRACSWPGNVRELRNLLRRAVALGAEGAVLRRLHDSEEKGPAMATPRAGQAPERCATFRAWMREREREYLIELVRRYPSVSQQAALSGLPQRTLYRKVRRVGLPSPGRSAVTFGDGVDIARTVRHIASAG